VDLAAPLVHTLAEAMFSRSFLVLLFPRLQMRHGQLETALVLFTSKTRSGFWVVPAAPRFMATRLSTTTCGPPQTEWPGNK